MLLPILGGAGDFDVMKRRGRPIGRAAPLASHGTARRRGGTTPARRSRGSQRRRTRRPRRPAPCRTSGRSPLWRRSDRGGRRDAGAEGDEHPGRVVLAGTAIVVFLVEPSDFLRLDRAHRNGAGPFDEKIGEMLRQRAPVIVLHPHDAIDDPLSGLAIDDGHEIAAELVEESNSSGRTLPDGSRPMRLTRIPPWVWLFGTMKHFPAAGSSVNGRSRDGTLTQSRARWRSGSSHFFATPGSRCQPQVRTGSIARLAAMDRALPSMEALFTATPSRPSRAQR